MYFSLMLAGHVVEPAAQSDSNRPFLLQLMNAERGARSGRRQPPSATLSFSSLAERAEWRKRFQVAVHAIEASLADEIAISAEWFRFVNARGLRDPKTRDAFEAHRDEPAGVRRVASGREGASQLGVDEIGPASSLVP